MGCLKPELDDQLAALAANGWSSSRIGLELGLTRNAVIGRCMRRGFQLLGKSCRQFASTPTTQPELKLPRICQPKPASASPSRSGKGRAPRQFSREAPKIAPLSKKLLAAFAPPVVAAEQRAWPTVDILGLTSLTCRWPIGDTPSDPNFQYCGAPKSIGPYCSDHGLVAYMPRGIDKVRRDDARACRAA